VSGSRSHRFNEKLWGDLFFATCFSSGEPQDVVALHLLDEATVLCLLPVLPGRTTGALRAGLTRWVEIWGWPETFAADREKGLCAEEFKIWLEENNCRIIPLPPATGSRHTAYALIDVHSQALRGSLHRLDSSLVEKGICATAQELFSLLSAASNSTRSRAGVAPIQQAAGLIPRDPLNLHIRDQLTSSQALGDGEQYLQRLVTRGVATNIFQEEVAKAKLVRIGETKARAGDVDPDLGVPKLEVRDPVEILRIPTKKDLSGWRGPAIITSIGDAFKEDGTENHTPVRVDWQGESIAVSWDQVRAFSAEVFFGGPEIGLSAMLRILRRVDENYDLWGRTPVILGRYCRFGNSGESRATTRMPQLWNEIQAMAAKGCWTIDGAVVGGGVRSFHAPTSEPGMLKLT